MNDKITFGEFMLYLIVCLLAPLFGFVMSAFFEAILYTIYR